MNKLPVFICILTVLGCSFLKPSEARVPVARVNESYLYPEDLKGLVASNMPKTDSTVLVQNFINHWATQQLLFDGALLNLSEEKQHTFDKMVAQYKNDLYVNAYLEALVQRSVDTVVGASEAKNYYEKNKTVFKLNENLIKFRYVRLKADMNNFKTIQTLFKRFNWSDKKILDSLAIQFKSYFLNDSTWLRTSVLKNKLPILKTIKKERLLKKANFIQLNDSLEVYLVHINDVLSRNEIAPLEYVKPTIDQIVINKRKLALIQQIEKDITKDAIENKQFEIYK